MEDSKIRYCKLCLIPIHDENDTAVEHVTKDVLSVTLLNPDLDDEIKGAMCTACSAKFFAAQKFKMTCLNTDSAINLYIDDTTKLPLDLREIYMEERKCERISDDVKVCRLCMQPIENTSEFESLIEEHVDMILKFVPEMNIFIIKEPVVCKLCKDSLGEYCNFLKKCLDAGQVIENRKVTDALTPVLSDDIELKIEEIDIEFKEDEPDFIKAEYLDKSINETENEREINVRERPLESVNIYKCEKCNFGTVHKGCLKRHMIIHKDPSELQIYKCDICNYETKEERYLKVHTVVHKNPSEVRMHKCGTCNYETKHGYNLKRHMLIHKDRSGAQLYVCQTCTYETNYQKNFKEHMLTHMDPSKVQMYKCTSCNYETRYKFYLKGHSLKHKDPSEVPLYKCENCDYKTKYKTCLRRHRMLLHKDQS